MRRLGHTLLKQKSPGAPIVLSRNTSFWLCKGNAGVCIHTPPECKVPAVPGASPFAGGRLDQSIYIELIIDGEIVERWSRQRRSSFKPDRWRSLARQAPSIDQLVRERHVSVLRRFASLLDSLKPITIRCCVTTVFLSFTGASESRTH